MQKQVHVRNDIVTEHTFSKRKHYMFGFNYHGGEPNEVIVETPHIISDNSLDFIFLYGYKSLNETVKVSDILAVADNNGTIKIIGWSGKFTILNKELFDKLVDQGVIRLR